MSGAAYFVLRPLDIKDGAVWTNFAAAGKYLGLANSFFVVYKTGFGTAFQLPAGIVLTWLPLAL
jgi:hypothetical protein